MLCNSGRGFIDLKKLSETEVIIEPVSTSPDVLILFIKISVSFAEPIILSNKESFPVLLFGP